MRHLTEGALRRMYDDPNSVDDTQRLHFADCSACQERFGTVAGDAREVRELFQGPGVTVDPQRAYARLQGRLREPRRRLLPDFGRRVSPGWRKPLVGALVAAGLVAITAFSPLAGNLVQLLQPAQVQPVVLSQQDLNSLQPLSNYGDVKWQQRMQRKQVASAAEAAAGSGLGQIKPKYLPKGIPTQQATYETAGESSASFTFSEARARAAAQKAGQPAPTFGPGVDGSTLVVKTGPGEGVIYGDLGKLKAAEKNGATDPQQAVSQVGPMLAIAKMKAPSVYSTGLSLAQLKQVLLSQPGLTPQARSLIESLDSQTWSLPIPIPAAQGTARTVTVNGVRGTLFGDNTGLGAGLVWIKNGVVYAVAGTVSQDELLTVAGGLG
jgi:hypothetical protein